MINDAKYWIENLKLQPHPEGGHYAETYHSQVYTSLGDVAQCLRKNCASLIYFLLKAGECSMFHRLQSDEIWLFHSGEPVTIYMIDEKGRLTTQHLGNELTDDENLQVFVPAHTWFAAELKTAKNYSLMSCLVSPGFTWEDFELADRKNLSAQFPQHCKLIERLTC